MTDALDIARDDDAAGDALLADALEVARWCWPEQSWREQRFGHGADRRLPSRPDIWEGALDRMDGPFGISAAEVVMLERGLAAAYGKALLQQEGVEIHYCDSHSMSDPEFCTEAARLATAPLDARARAMAAVIREQKVKA